MTTYRPLRIAPDMPARAEEIDDDTPPASPYRNRLPPKARPSINFFGLFKITLPRPELLIGVGLVLLTMGWLFTPKRYKPRIMRPTHEPALRYKNVDWRLFAYAMHAADDSHICSALMVFEQLDRLGSRAERVLFYPHDWEENRREHMPPHVNHMLSWARDNYNVHLKPVKVYGVQLPETNTNSGKHRYRLPDGTGMDPSITKFLTMSQTSYLRLIFLDPTITLLKHLDELFMAPDARMAMTRRYLNPTSQSLSAHFFMVEPREADAESLFDLAKKSIWNNDYYDSQVLTEYYGDQAMVLSHKKYGINSAEFRREDHYDFMGNEWEEFVPERVMREGSIVLFDEEPIPKPWVDISGGVPEKVLPHCSFEKGSEKDISCRQRAIWIELYRDYKARRKSVCRMTALPGDSLELKKPDSENDSEGKP